MHAQEVFKAISDPTRRRVLKLLRRGSRTAGELAGAFALSKPTLSHHFAVLKAADLVRCERRGQQMVYSLNTTVFEDVAATLLDLFRPQKDKEQEQQPQGRSQEKNKQEGSRHDDVEHEREPVESSRERGPGGGGVRRGRRPLRSAS